jgi:hypothetical protein
MTTTSPPKAEQYSAYGLTVGQHRMADLLSGLRRALRAQATPDDAYNEHFASEAEARVAWACLKVALHGPIVKTPP